MTGAPVSRPPRDRARTARALWFWARRTTDIAESGYRPLRAAEGTLALPLAFVVATLIEVVVLHLLVPWAWASVVLGVLSLWSLLLVLGAVAGDIAYPHYLTDRELVLRRAGRRVAVIPLDRIAAVIARRRYDHTGTVVDAGRLFLAGPDGTTVDLVLRDEVDVRVESLLPGSRFSGVVRWISLYLDEPFPAGVVPSPRAGRRVPGSAAPTETGMPRGDRPS
ncbi:hypothetical protein [Nocardia sp. X0981]